MRTRPPVLNQCGRVSACLVKIPFIRYINVKLHTGLCILLFRTVSERFLSSISLSSIVWYVVITILSMLLPEISRPLQRDLGV